MKKIAVVYFSKFHGHTRIVADAVMRGVRDAGGHVLDVDVTRGVPWDDLAQCDALVFGSPTYMGSVAAEFKKFMDDSSSVWMKAGWRDKLAAGFTCSHGLSGDKLNVLIQMTVFAAQHGMVWIGPAQPQEGSQPHHINRLGSFLGVMAQADTKEGPPTPPEGDLKSAALLGRRMVEWAEKAA